MIGSVAALRRALPVGARVHITNHLYPAMSREATVLRATTTSLQTTFPGSDRGAWFDFPKRAHLVPNEDGSVTILTDDGAQPFLTLRVIE